MSWRRQPAPDLPDLIVFDGDCVLCSRAARFVHAHDAAGRFNFVAIQSPLGRALAKRFGIDADAPETNLAVVQGQAHFKADAGLEILSASPRWRWMRAAKAIPRPVRNWLYDRLARNRYKIFGRREACWANDPSLKARVIESEVELGARPQSSRGGPHETGKVA
jgi:predicted DCC family thiol-disulfide oxidoreductase YuxK